VLFPDSLGRRVDAAAKQEVLYNQTTMFTLLTVLAFAPAAGIEADAAKPYDLQIVLRVAPHRLLTPTFRRQLAADLKDAMQASLGALAQVEIVDAVAHPEAWQPFAALDSQTQLHPTKRHFVQVEIVDSQYVVTARQHDGSTGQASPRSRQARTSDRDFVARLAARFLDSDFGAVGTVVAKDSDVVRLQLRGGSIAGADLNRLVPVGSVFALTRIEGEPRRGKLVPATYLRVMKAPAEGICECQLLSRYLNPLADWPQVNYRAIRLGTTSAQVRLRLVDPNGLPLQNLLVFVSPQGFRATDPVTDQGAAHEGWFTSSKSYNGMAFVRVVAGDQQRPIPVAILDDRPVVCEMTVAADSEARQQFDLDVRNARQRLQDILRRLSEQNRQIEAMLRDSKNKDALEKITAGQELLTNELTLLGAEVARLRELSASPDSPSALLLDQCDLFLKDARARRDSLGRFESDLKKAFEAENSPENQAKRERYLALTQRAETQREDADFDGAIQTYETILSEFGARPDTQRRLDDLKAAWAIKSDEHKQARNYAYTIWAKVASFEDVKNRLPKAREMFEVCRSVGDKLTALKFSLVAANAAEIIVRAVEELEQSQNDSDKLNLKDARRASQDLQAFLTDLSKFIRSEEKKN
jgi:hypothetical protein